MADKFSKAILRIVLAQISKNIGFGLATVSSLDVLQDLLTQFIQCLNDKMRAYMEHAGRTEPIFDDVGLAFRSMGISLRELIDYLEQVGSIEFPAKELPQYPVKTPTRLNIPAVDHPELKTRPDYIPQFLPLLKPEEPKQEPSTSASSSNLASRSPSKSANRKGGARVDDLRVDDWLNGDSFADFDAFAAGLVKTVRLAASPSPPPFVEAKTDARVPIDLASVDSATFSTSEICSNSTLSAAPVTLIPQPRLNSALDRPRASSSGNNVAPERKDSMISNRIGFKSLASTSGLSADKRRSDRQFLRRYNRGGKTALNTKRDEKFDNGTKNLTSTAISSHSSPIGPLKIRIETPPPFVKLSEANAPSTSLKSTPVSSSKPSSNDNNFSIDECISSVIEQTHALPSLANDDSNAVSTDFFERLKNKHLSVDAMGDSEHHKDFIESVVKQVCGQSSALKETTQVEESKFKFNEINRRRQDEAANAAAEEKAQALVKTLKLTFPALKLAQNKLPSGKRHDSPPVLPSVSIEETSATFQSSAGASANDQSAPESELRKKYKLVPTPKKLQINRHSTPRGRPPKLTLNSASSRTLSTSIRKKMPPAKFSSDSSALFRPDVAANVKRVAPLVLPLPKIAKMAKIETCPKSVPPVQTGDAADRTPVRKKILAGTVNFGVRSAKTASPHESVDDSVSGPTTCKLGPLKIKLQVPHHQKHVVDSPQANHVSTAPVKAAKRGRPPSAEKNGSLKKRFKLSPLPPDSSKQLQAAPDVTKPESISGKQPSSPTPAAPSVPVLKIPKLILKLGPKPPDEGVSPVTSIEQISQRHTSPSPIKTPPSSASSSNSFRSTRFDFSLDRKDQSFEQSFDQSMPSKIATHSAPSTSFSPPPPTPSPRSVGSISPAVGHGVGLYGQPAAEPSTPNLIDDQQDDVEEGRPLVEPDDYLNHSGLIEEYVAWPEQSSEPVAVGQMEAPAFHRTHAEPETKIEEQHVVDGEDKIWYCPVCQVAYEDGVDMIACDKCDNWFHWTCVGLNRAPPDHEHWFCKGCDRPTKAKSSAKKKIKR